jgi:Flp pilus assembly protein CpaB
MSRRARAAVFLLLALSAAAVAAAMADRYGSSVARGYGALRPVAVASATLPAGKEIDAAAAAAAIEVRRVPLRFAPPDALADPREAVGLAPRGDLPAGSYLVASELRPLGRRRPPGLSGSRHPVELAVSGADALLAANAGSEGSAVDVIVTTEPTGSGPGRTYVAARRVPLIGLGPGDDGPGGLAAATLGLTRHQALTLLAAQSFARQLTLLPER